MTKPRARAYIDGINRYHGALRDSSHKWVDFEALVARLMPHADIDAVIYCTARVSNMPNDPDVSTRQDTFFRALAAHCRTLEFVEGNFRKRRVMGLRVPERGCPCCDDSLPTIPCHCCSHVTSRVEKYEEKGSDVNLASRLLSDAYKDLFDTALVISGDSDLQLAVDIVKDEIGKPVVVCDPRGRRNPPLLGSEKRVIRPAAIAGCQLPIPVIDAAGREIRPPKSWT